MIQLKRQLWPFDVANCWTGTVAAADLDGAGLTSNLSLKEKMDKIQ